MARKYSRRKKTNPNTYILWVTALAAIVLSGAGVQANNFLTLANVGLITLGLALAIALAWFVYWKVRVRGERQLAVTAEGIDRMGWKEFELAVIRLLKTQGFSIKRHSSSPGDQGADIIAAKKGDRYAIQVKHYHRKLDNTPVQEAVAAKAVYKCNKAMVITNSHFTAGAAVLGCCE
jgi:HJR/Mrr/RecB family endonuclease